MTDAPRYHVKLVSEAAYGGVPGPPGMTGLRVEVNIPRPSDAPAVLRAVADRLEVNRLTLED